MNFFMMRHYTWEFKKCSFAKVSHTTYNVYIKVMLPIVVLTWLRHPQQFFFEQDKKQHAHGAHLELTLFIKGDTRRITKSTQYCVLKKLSRTVIQSEEVHGH
jgi:hypothetical protein